MTVQLQGDPRSLISIQSIKRVCSEQQDITLEVGTWNC